MKIVTRNSDGAILMVSDCNATFDPSTTTTHNLPGWDWSLADLSGVDMNDPFWVYCQMRWDGATLVPRSTPLPKPS